MLGNGRLSKELALYPKKLILTEEQSFCIVTLAGNVISKPVLQHQMMIYLLPGFYYITILVYHKSPPKKTTHSILLLIDRFLKKRIKENMYLNY